ncbi:MAG: 2-amino-4-hydroxy-6-hydroxymethyldihydropteridine diphosphokinase [Bacteroidota bacterium]
MGFHTTLKSAFRQRAVLLLGGNLGDPLSFFASAEKLLERNSGNIIARSPVYLSEPWGNAEQPVFMNQALLLVTPLPPALLLQRLLDIEKALGRIRKERWGPRIIDIDLLCYGNKVCKSEFLSLPHPALPERRFALLPMSKVAAHWRHPVLGKTTLQLLHGCTDPLKVWKMKG